MHPHDRGRIRFDLAMDDGDVFRIVERVAEADRFEAFPIGRVQDRFDAALEEAVILATPGDEVGNRADLEIVQLGEGDEIWQAGH